MAVSVVKQSGRYLAFGFVLTCAFALMSSPAFAQEATIFGQVTDASSGVLPGVTVTVSSPALQVRQVVEVTNTEGEYRVTALPLGTYTVEYTLPGFQTLRREGIRLTAGFVARVDVSLQVGGVAETVTVSGLSPVVDVKTTSGGTQVTREVLETIATNRNSLNSVLTLAAGSRGITEMVPVQNEVIYQAFGRLMDPWLLVEGIPTVSSTAGNPNNGNRMNFEMIEEAMVKTFGGSAESPTAGIQVTVIVKSGGNDFHGSAAGYQTAGWMQASNLNDELRAQGITSTSKFDPRYDVTSELGGRIIRDKLWFYGNVRRRKEGLSILGGVNADGSQSVDFRLQRFVTGKTTLQMTSTQRLIGSYIFQQTLGDLGPVRFQDPVGIKGFNSRSQIAKAEWQLTRGNKFLSVVGGNAALPSLPNFPPEGFTPEQLTAWMDQVTPFFGGTDEQVGRFTSSGRSSVSATMNWYKPDLFNGTHDFKFGSQYNFRGHTTRAYFDVSPAGNYLRVYRNGVPTEVNVFNNTVEPVSRLDYLGTFFQDSWAVNRRLTLNLGVRYANDQAWLPEQCREAAPAPFAGLYPAQCFEEYHMEPWNTVSPRLHAAFDVTGDGKTVIKGGWGRFYVMHNQDMLDPFSANTAIQTRFRWRDLNNNRLWDAGESNLDLNGPDFLAQSLRSNAAFAGMVENRDLKPTGSDEFSLSLERELMADLGVRVTGIYSKDFDSFRIENMLRPYAAYNIPITNPDPGPDNILRTADDPGTSFTYFDYPASLRGNAFQRPRFINHDGSNGEYKSVEVAANRRLANRWQLSASYTVTKYDNVGLSYNYAWRGGDFNPNFEINRARNTWDWLTRAAGSYLFPADIQVSANILYQSGDPWGRTVSFRGGQQIPSITLPVEETGARRTPAIFLTMFRGAKAFQLPRGQRLSVETTILNLTNNAGIAYGNDTVPLVNMRSGPQLGYATRILNPRIGQVGIKYSF